MRRNRRICLAILVANKDVIILLSFPVSKTKRILLSMLKLTLNLQN